MYDDAKEKIRSIDSAWSNAVAEMVDARIELHRLRDDTIFDEDKSVRWNRDEAVRRKDALSPRRLMSWPTRRSPCKKAIRQPLWTI